MKTFAAWTIWIVLFPFQDPDTDQFMGGEVRGPYGAYPTRVECEIEKSQKAEADVAFSDTRGMGVAFSTCAVLSITPKEEWAAK